MTPEQRQPLEALSRRLLDFHKALLDWERANYETENGRIASPGEFLGLVLDHAQFAWLRQLSGLIVEIDEATAPRSKAPADLAEALLEQTRILLNESPDRGPFQKRLGEALDHSPEAARMHQELRAKLV
jgi:trans-aconitate methyltransferase